MESSCYETAEIAENRCDDYGWDKDNFGGQTKAVAGFKSYQVCAPEEKTLS